MAIQSSSKTVALANGTFSFLAQEGDYKLDFSKDFVQVKLDGGQMTNVSDQQFFSATNFDVSHLDQLAITGVTLSDAAANVVAGKGDLKFRYESERSDQLSSPGPWG